MDVRTRHRDTIYLIDSGASHDVAPGQHTRDVYAPQVRALLDECSVDTANATVTFTDGVSAIRPLGRYNRWYSYGRM